MPNVGMSNAPQTSRISKITIPQSAHPITKLIYTLARDTGTRLLELSDYAGIQYTTLKSWRREKIPSLQSVEAALGAFSWRLVPCPPLSSLPAEVRSRLEEVSQSFRSDDECLAAAIRAFAEAPERGVREGNEPAAMSYPKGFWLRPAETFESLADVPA